MGDVVQLVNDRPPRVSIHPARVLVLPVVRVERFAGASTGGDRGDRDPSIASNVGGSIPPAGAS